MILPCLHARLPYYADSSLYFEIVRTDKWPIFLDSTHVNTDNARFDIISANPFITIVSAGKTTTITDSHGHVRQLFDDPFHLLQSVLEPLQQKIEQTVTDLPFCGGAIGYFSYDLGRRLEVMPILTEDAEHIPDMVIGIYDWAIINDHQQKKCWLASFGLAEQTHQDWQGLVGRLSNLQQPDCSTTFNVIGELTSNFTRAQYQRAFDKIQHYIAEGDCYQVNLAKRFEIDAHGDPWVAYRWLRQHNPAPFSAFFATDHVTLMSSSPERLLHVQNKQVETRPIKGTIRRNLDDNDDDIALAEALLSSSKDQSENLMIVDLLRNDLGKVCTVGSIQATQLFSLESYANVHHLVSTITGILPDNENTLSLLRACFPGGSITGAPKLRAMEIIEELEPNRRGAYCGSMAYLGFDGNMDSNILIRTLVYSDNSLRFWAGGGIVADSIMDNEYQEVHSKAAAMLALVARLRES